MYKKQKRNKDGKYTKSKWKLKLILLTIIVTVGYALVTTTNKVEVKQIVHKELSPLDKSMQNTRKMVQYQLNLEADYIKARETRNKAQRLFDEVSAEYTSGLETLSLFGGGAIPIYSELSTLNK